MEQSSSEKQLRIRKQFDSFCKTLLKNEMIDYERARSYRQKCVAVAQGDEAYL